MLHLLTSQVSGINVVANRLMIVSIGKLGESHFNLDKDNSEWLKFCKFTYKINLEQSDAEADEPLLTNIHV